MNHFLRLPRASHRIVACALLWLFWTGAAPQLRAQPQLQNGAPMVVSSGTFNPYLDVPAGQGQLVVTFRDYCAYHILNGDCFGGYIPTLFAKLGGPVVVRDDPVGNPQYDADYSASFLNTPLIIRNLPLGSSRFYFKVGSTSDNILVAYYTITATFTPRPPTITAQPQSRTVPVGSTATFGVSATGESLSYQWQRNGGNIGGANGPNYTIFTVQPGDAGSYRCVVSNPGGSATSDAATLTVQGPPTITTHPQSQTATQGQTVILSVVASGNPVPAFQWRKNGTDIAGATASSFTIANFTPADAGNYSVVVANAFGSPVSSIAVLRFVTCTSIPPGLVSWWRAEGDGRDSVGTNHGTLKQGAGFASGLVGQGLSLDGDDDYVQVADSPSLHFGAGQDFTLTAWVNLTAPVAGYTDDILWKIDNENLRRDQTNYSMLGFFIDENRRLNLRMYPISATYRISSSNTVPLSTWTHVSAVRRGTTVELYLNGALDAQGTVASGSLVNTDPLCIGALYDRSSSPPIPRHHTFGGLIDEVTIFNRALGAAEVAAMHAADRAGFCLNSPSAITNLVWIPPGTFTLGSPTNEPGREPWESPQTQVTFTRGFWMGKYEVTQGDFQAVMGFNPSQFSGDLNRPVENLTWEQAVQFCDRLTRAEAAAGRLPPSYTYRLPTEAEWEYACRAGTNSRFSFGEDEALLAAHAWYATNSGGVTHPVGQKPPNPWGLHDMHGNVFEFCLDWSENYPGGSVTNLVAAPGTIYHIYRASRGGSSFSEVFRCRSAYRGGLLPTYAWNGQGLRVVLAQDPRSPVPAPSPNLAWIPPGTFTMGSPTNEVGHTSGEEPQTQVTLTRGFWMGKYEVTQAEYLSVMNTNPSAFTGDLNRPVEMVSWEEAVRYCDALTQRELAAGRLPAGFAYRLPTEAEWEYACRAGSATAWSFGSASNNLPEYTWFLGNSGSTTHPVGNKLPNPWGVYDSHGNVWEWCLDWNGSYAGGSVIDPKGPPSGVERIARGGSFTRDPLQCRSAYRLSRVPTYQVNAIGFRVVLAVSEPPPPAPQWVGQISGGSNSVARSVAFDASGNCVVAGAFSETCSFGPTNLVSNGSLDTFIAKFNSSGVLLWVRQAGGTGDDRAKSIAMDAAGNAYVAGKFFAEASFGSTNLTGTNGSFHVFVAKYDPAGNLAWTRQLGGFTPLSFEYPYGLGLTCNSAGDVWVTGYFDGTRAFGSTNLVSGDSYDAFVARLDAQGDVVWVRQAGGFGGEFGQAVTVDVANQVFVVGHYYADVNFGTTNLGTFRASDLFLAKYDSAGNVLWATRAGGTANVSQWETGYGLATDAAGNCYVTGSFDSLDARFGDIALTSRGTNDIFLAKYNPSGTLVWIRQLGGASDDVGHSVALANDGSVFVTGYFISPNASFDGVPLSSAGGNDVFVSRFSADGAPLGVQRFGGIGNDIGWGVAVDAFGNPGVVGQFQGSIDFGFGAITNAGTAGAFVARLANTAYYFNDFETAAGAGWSRTNRALTPSGGRSFLGRFGREDVSLTLTNLPPHKSVEISFDLFIILSWDGNSASFGPDLWALQLDDRPLLLRASFQNSNVPEGQSYPAFFGSGVFPKQTGAAAVNTLGYIEGTFNIPQDAVYRLSFSVPHDAPDLRLIFQGLPSGTSLNDESWGLDNVSITLRDDTLPPAPVPVTLAPITNVWRFWTNAPAPDWFAPEFDDGAWPAGPALLHHEANTLPAPKLTPLALGRTTYYFRTHFNLASNVPVAELTLRALVDDGAVFYLNGQELARLRMPAAPAVIAYDTLALATPPGGDATTFEDIILPAAVLGALRAGSNVLAVEVHQQSATSSDIVFGAEIGLGINVVPGGLPVIVSAPQPVMVASNGTAVLRVVAASVEPVTYEWRRNGVPLPGQTNATLVLPNVQPSATGLYDVRVVNPNGSVVSGPALLTVGTRPYFIMQPSPQTNVVVEDGSATFAVRAGGTPPLTFRWRRGSLFVTNETSANDLSLLTLTNLQPGSATNITVVVTNLAGTTPLSAAAWLYVMRDADGDGLGDEWELANGLNPGKAADFGTDSDGDGLTNGEEFIAGTNPTNAASTLELQSSVTAETNRVALTFEAMPHKSYVIECVETVSIGANWQTVTVIAPTNQPRSITITNDLSPGSRQRFYRLRTPAWP